MKEFSGLFTSLEGIDFTGKTPIQTWLKEDIEKNGFRVDITRDPPYKLTPWDKFYEHFERGKGLTDISNAFLLLSSRLDNFERVIKPGLKSRSVVIADRFLDSWFAYQSVMLSKYFGGEEFALQFLVEINNKLVDQGLLSYPDLTLFIDNDPEVTMERAKGEEVLSKYEVIDTQVKVASQYHRLVELFPDRIKVIDARGIEIPEVYQIAKKIVMSELDNY